VGGTETTEFRGPPPDKNAWEGKEKGKSLNKEMKRRQGGGTNGEWLHDHQGQKLELLTKKKGRHRGAKRTEGSKKRGVRITQGGGWSKTRRSEMAVVGEAKAGTSNTRAVERMTSFQKELKKGEAAEGTGLLPTDHGMGYLG